MATHATIDAAGDAGELQSVEWFVSPCNMEHDSCSSRINSFSNTLNLRHSGKNSSKTTSLSGSEINEDTVTPKKSDITYPYFNIETVHQSLVKERSVEQSSLSVNNKSQVPLFQDSSRNRKDADPTLPFVTFLLSIICPLFGCLGFFLCLNCNEKSIRYKWAIRSLYLGCLLSFIYSVIICCVLSHVTRTNRCTNHKLRNNCAARSGTGTDRGTEFIYGKDMLLLPDGSTYHLGVKEGDLFPRILTVGANARAKTISSLFDNGNCTKEISSSRQFYVYSGHYKGVGVSIIAIGMGAPMMDFMVREATFVQPGPMAIIRLGTCGLFNKDLVPGTVVTAGKGSMYVYVNYAHFNGCANDTKIGKDSPPYLICNPVPCNKTLNELLVKSLTAQNLKTYDGLNACGETFYSCQGRKDPRFNDKNEDIVDTLLKNGVDFVEMETHQLFHLAKLREAPCHTAAAAIGIVSRTQTTNNITAETLHAAELNAGRACLDALIEFKF